MTKMEVVAAHLPRVWDNRSSNTDKLGPSLKTGTTITLVAAAMNGDPRRFESPSF
jgi:hypothetical protein